MEIASFAGKGGVGKSTSAAAYAIYNTYNDFPRAKTLLVDHDGAGAHSLTRVLGLEKHHYSSNTIHETEIPNLSLAIIDKFDFEPITEMQKQGKSVSEYLAQFPGDYGLLPFCDMATAFFGVPTDVLSVSKFASITKLGYQADQEDINHIIIDVEPTAGLERLLNSVTAITRSLKNLKEAGWPLLTVLGTKWPDVKAYLQGDFIQNADKYTSRLNVAAMMLKQAKYILVCTPESSPVNQMTDVETLVRAYGGQVTGYVINNIRGEPHEEIQIQRVHQRANGKPVIEVKHNEVLCEESNPRARRSALKASAEPFIAFQSPRPQ